MQHYHWVTNELNAITLTVVVAGFALILTLKWLLWRWIHEQIRLLRLELPGKVVGELMTRDEFKDLWERVIETEAKLEHVESRLDEHLGVCLDGE